MCMYFAYVVCMHMCGVEGTCICGVCGVEGICGVCGVDGICGVWCGGYMWCVWCGGYMKCVWCGGYVECVWCGEGHVVEFVVWRLCGAVEDVKGV